MKNTKLAFIAALLFPSTFVLAESSAGGFDPFVNALNGQTIQRNDGATQPDGGGGGNSLSQGIAKQNEASVDTIQDHSADNAQNGREYKAGDAQGQSNAGKGAAIAAGTGMVAAAIPLLASIIPMEVAAGADLMAKAGLEFAQAGADSSTASKNKAQKDLLKAKANQDGGMASAETGAADALKANPQLNDFLAQRGVNSDDFINRLASGQITNSQAVLGAVGNTTAIPAEAQAEGDLLAASQMGSFFAKPEPLGNIDNMRISNDDNAKLGNALDENKAGAGGADVGGSRQAVASTSATTSNLENGSGPAAGVRGTARAEGLLGSARASGVHGSGAGETSAGDVMAGLLGALGGADRMSGSSVSLSGAELAKVGIIRVNGKQNIFQLGHRNYRSFLKWRKQTTHLAQNVR